jgi:hypothetical protein
MAKSSAGASKTHCKRGHPYNKENTIHGKRRANKLSIFKEYKIRICKACYKLCLEKIERNRTPEEKARIVQKRREKYLEKKRLLQTSL